MKLFSEYQLKSLLGKKIFFKYTESYTCEDRGFTWNSNHIVERYGVVVNIWEKNRKQLEVKIFNWNTGRYVSQTVRIPVKQVLKVMDNDTIFESEGEKFQRLVGGIKDKNIAELPPFAKKRVFELLEEIDTVFRSVKSY